MKRLSICLCVLLMMISCGGNSGKKQTTDYGDDVTRVIYFHTKKRCITCNAIERLSQEVVDMLGSKHIVMQVVDITEDEAMADQYEVSWSSLVLDRGGKVVNLTEMAFANAKHKPEEFKKNLVDALEAIEQ